MPLPSCAEVVREEQPMDSRSSDSALDQRCVGSIGRLTRISWSVATTRHPVQSSTFSVWNIVDTRSNNALRPSRARPHKKETLRECRAYGGAGPKNRDPE